MKKLEGSEKAGFGTEKEVISRSEDALTCVKQAIDGKLPVSEKVREIIREREEALKHLQKL